MQPSPPQRRDPIVSLVSAGSWWIPCFSLVAARHFSQLTPTTLHLCHPPDQRVGIQPLCSVHTNRMLCVSSALTAIRPSRTTRPWPDGRPLLVNSEVGLPTGGSLSNAVERFVSWWIFAAPSQFPPPQLHGDNAQIAGYVHSSISSLALRSSRLLVQPWWLRQQPSSCLSRTQNNPDRRCSAISRPTLTPYIRYSPAGHDVPAHPALLSVSRILTQPSPTDRPGAAGHRRHQQTIGNPLLPTEIPPPLSARRASPLGPRAFLTPQIPNPGAED
jgi:hypothetical protein